MASASINQAGGIVSVNAGSVPTGHTISMTSSASWLKVYKNNQASVAASATSNTSASDRSCTVSVTATTTTNSSYNPTSVSVTCAWTVTQAGTGSTPTPSYNFNLTVQNSTNTTLAFAVSTSPNSAGILASGTVTYNSVENAFDVILPLTSSTQPLYLLVATESRTDSFVLGWGTVPSCVRGCWLPNQEPTQITTYSAMQWVVPGPNAAPANGTTWENLSGNMVMYAMYS